MGIGAFLVAGLTFLGALILAAIMIFAAGMSDNPSASEDVGKSALGVLIVGTIFAVLIGLTHWFPHIGW